MTIDPQQRAGSADAVTKFAFRMRSSTCVDVVRLDVLIKRAERQIDAQLSFDARRRASTLASAPLVINFRDVHPTLMRVGIHIMRVDVQPSLSVNARCLNAA